MRYHIFDALVDSDMALPELPEAGGDAPRIRVRTGAPGGFDPGRYTLAFTWRHPGQPVVCQVSRDGDHYLFEYPGTVAFHLTLAGDIHCMPGKACTPGLLRHLLINQAIPRLLAEQGELVLHASAVCWPGQHAVAFTGRSGSGKSTLAAYLAAQGARVLADDCILLRPGTGQGVQAIGAYPGLRLWPGTGLAGGELSPASRNSSGRAVDIPGEFRAVHSATTKRQASYPNEENAAAAPLAAVMLIDQASAGSQSVITPIRGAPAMMSALREAFSLDPSRAEASERGFLALGRVLDAGLVLAEFAYPRRVDALGDVASVLADWLRDEAPAKREKMVP